MTEKKKLIRVKGLRGANKPIYALTSFNFCFVSEPDPEREQVTPIATCREHLNRNVMLSLNRGKCDNQEIHGTDKTVDTSKLRLLIVSDPTNIYTFKSKLFNGKAVLNVIEELAGWEKSKITTVKHEIYSNAWLITGPKEWMSQPQLLSIATWILRLTADYGPLNTESYDELEANLYRVFKREERNTSTARGYADAQTYLKYLWDKLYIIISFHNEIFNNISTEVAWKYVSGEDGPSFTQNSGFLEFVNGNRFYLNDLYQSQKVFKELCKKVLPRKNECLTRVN